MAIALVDELEHLGARFSFFLDEDDEVSFAWLCQGIANFRRCQAILRLGCAQTEFGEAFYDEVCDRYLAGRMQMEDRRSA